MAGYLSQQFLDYGGSDLANALDFVGWNQKRKYNDATLQAQKINQDMALEDLDFTRKDNPLKLQRSQFENQGLEYLLPQKQAIGENAQRDLQVRKGVPIEDEITAAKSKLAREITDDDLKATNAAIEKALVDPSPNVRAQALMLRQHMSDIVKLREGFANKTEIENIKADARKQAAEEASARQLAAIAARAAVAKQLAAAKGPKGYQEAATRYRILAEDADDPAVKQRYLALANEFEQAAQEQAKAGKAGAIDAGAVADLPTTSVTPKLGKGENAPTPKVPAGRVIIYKDGKPVGTVPEAQKDEAVKQGYTLN